MGLIGRLVRLVLVAVLALAVAVGAFVAAVTVRALPQTSGTLEVPGLDSEVTIHRDDAGAARIYADTPHDLFMAQGYVHAQERLWQMEVWRHISAGRLSELFGRSTLDTDRFIRTLGWRRAAERDLASFSPDVVAALRAYADGVNAYLEQHRGNLGLAFVVTGLRTGSGGIGGYEPEPWTPLDSAAWQKVQSWNLGGDFDAELFRLLADARLGDPALTDDLIPPYPADRPVITPTAGTAAGPTSGSTATSPIRTPSPATTAPEGMAIAGLRRLAAIADSIPRLAGLDPGGALLGDHGIGSNEWVVAPSRSASGGALLANDPHLGLSMPSVWYINGLHCREVSEACPFDVVGVSFPGVPAVVLGHNGRIAWGATNLGPDVQDLFVETIDPANPDAYLFEGRSMPFETRSEEIAIAGGETVELVVRETVHGPIVNDVVDALTDHPPMALRWTALVEPDRTLEAIFRINTAGDFAGFREALRAYGSPAQNFIYADAAGHIGYQFPGYVPVRQGAPGNRPRPGDGGHEWVGRIPFEELPSQFDPPDGVIVTANNAAVDDAYPYFVASAWDYGDRAARIVALLDEASEGGITLDEMRAIQGDTYVLRADRIVPHLADAAPATADGQELLERILAWDRTCGVDSEGCAAYVAFELRLGGAIFDDELGPLARDYVGTVPSWTRIAALFEEPAAHWWDDVGTPAVETAPDVVGDALDATAAELRAALGEPSNWTWGKLHTISLREDTLGGSGIAPLEWYFNTPPRPAPGAAGTVNNLSYDPARAYPNPYDPEYEPVGLDRVFEVRTGPSFRLAIDLSDLDGAEIIQSTGQSGNPFDRHYGDLVERWLDGETLPLPWRRAAVERDAVDTLVLVPAEAG